MNNWIHLFTTDSPEPEADGVAHPDISVRKLYRAVNCFQLDFNEDSHFKVYVPQDMKDSLYGAVFFVLFMFNTKEQCTT